jgi:predicted Zn-dependent peptidase
VLAVHVLLEHRSLVEPAGKEGLADLTHRLLAKGTRDRDAAELQSALAEIGAELKCVDDENIPYDDYQTSSRFSYVRFQTLDEFFLRGFRLLGEILTRPRFAADDFTAARDAALRIAAKDAKSSQAVASRSFLASVWPALGAHLPVYGTDASLRAITLDDVRAFHAWYFRPDNMIITVATSLPPELVARAMEKSLADLPGSARPAAVSENAVSPAAPPALGSERAYVIAGRAIRAAADDVPALEIAAAIANQRTSFELRERQGLAYSMGARVSFVGDAGWFSAGLGTRAEQSDRALAELTKELDRLTTVPATQDELERARSEILRQRLMRELTRMGRAYAIGVAAYAGDELRAPDVEIDRFKKVSLEDVQRAIREHLAAGEWVTVIGR